MHKVFVRRPGDLPLAWAMQDNPRFAETAAEAWSPVTGWRARARGPARPTS
jgi:hypothetical protein